MSGPVEEAITAVAARQGWHVRAEQLQVLGLTRQSVHYRVKRGFLIPVHQGVYAVGRVPTNPLEKAAGALLACGPRAALSHASAAVAWGIWQRWAPTFEVSCALDRRPKGIRVHHRPALLRSDITSHLDLSVTTPALTLLDLAPRLPLRRRIRAFNELRLSHGLETEDVASLLARFPRHPGARLLRPIVVGATGEPTRSGFEDDWPPFADLWHLIDWEMNQHVCGYRVDVIFLPDLLIVELDGWATHGTPASFERDRDQDADILARTGIPTLRITRKQLHGQPAKQASRICSILAARRAESA